MPRPAQPRPAQRPPSQRRPSLGSASGRGQSDPGAPELYPWQVGNQNAVEQPPGPEDLRDIAAAQAQGRIARNRAKIADLSPAPVALGALGGGADPAELENIFAADRQDYARILGEGARDQEAKTFGRDEERLVEASGRWAGSVLTGL